MTAAVDEIDWPAVRHELDGLGLAGLGRLLDPDQCRSLADLYDDESRFR